MITLTERDVFVPAASTTSVSTFDAESQLRDWAFHRRQRPAHVEYLMSDDAIRLPDQAQEIVVSPMWLGRVKKRLGELAELPPNWDSYGALPVDPRIPSLVAGLVEWFAVDDMPPPDVFATSDGGVQIEWHIRRVNAEIAITPEDTTIYFQDLDGGEPWSRPSSDADLRTLRRRLLTHV